MKGRGHATHTTTHTSKYVQDSICATNAESTKHVGHSAPNNVDNDEAARGGAVDTRSTAKVVGWRFFCVC